MNIERTLDGKNVNINMSEIEYKTLKRILMVYSTLTDHCLIPILYHNVIRSILDHKEE